MAFHKIIKNLKYYLDLKLLCILNTSGSEERSMIMQKLNNIQVFGVN